MKRYGWVRALPLLGAAGYVGLLHVPQLHPTGWDWAGALASAALVLLGGRFPLSVTLAQCALLLAVKPIAPIGGGVVELLAGVALAELAFRRGGRPLLLGAVAVAATDAVGYYRPYPLPANVLIVLLDVAVPILLGSYLRSQRQLAGQRVAEAEGRRERELLAVRAAERTSIARELHDVVAHHVAAIVLRVGVARHVVPAEGEVAEVLDDVHAIGGQALGDLRRLVAVLRDEADSGEPAVTDPAAALDDVIERTRRAGVPVASSIDAGAVHELDTVHRLAVLRLVQEALTNVLKHAGAGAHTAVTVQQAGSGLRVEITDNGGGGGTRNEDGHGLIVMRERVELLDGEFQAGPHADGWAVSAVLPG